MYMYREMCYINFSLTLPMSAISLFLFDSWEDVLKEDEFCEL